MKHRAKPDLSCLDAMILPLRGTSHRREPRGVRLGTVNTIRSRYKPVIDSHRQTEPEYDPAEIQRRIDQIRQLKMRGILPGSNG